jgi:nucleotide-binding universal stress UspA family protein
MLKDILVHLASDIGDDGTVDYAISIALAFDAHLAGAAFANDEVPPSFLADGVPPTWIDEYREQAQDAAKSAVSRFEAAAARAGIPVQAGWLSESFTGAANLFARMARRFDLSVVRRSETGQSGLAPLIIEAALFETGRPVLVVPPDQKAGIKLDRVVIGWDGSASATRAVGDAMPFLRRAKLVELVMVVEQTGNEEAAGADIVQHLARHDLAVELKQIVSPHVKPANVLLSHAKETAADLLVLGGYGHSRLREFVLGGVTRSVLAAVAIPTLMSH